MIDDPNQRGFWFVSRGAGSLRIGHTSSGSRRVKREIKLSLIEEGKLKAKEAK